LIVDITGLVLKVVVHPADNQDREGVQLLLEPIKGMFPRMKKVWVDQGCTGKGREWIEQEMGWEVEVVRHAPRPRGMWVWPGMEITQELLEVFKRPKGFRHLPRRWVVERTLAWIGLYRLLRICVPKQAGKEFCGKPCPFCGEGGKDRSGGHHQRIVMERIS
jgi:putative transposase